jgi:hypothetical protein
MKINTVSKPKIPLLPLCQREKSSKKMGFPLFDKVRLGDIF